MADPTPYTPSYSFNGWQAANPAKPLPAAPLDNETANISASITSLVSAVKDVRRSDGALKNAVVTLDSLADEVRVPYTGGAVAAWQAPVTYATGIAAVSAAPATTVVYLGSTYVCVTAHTTSAIFDAAKWQLIASKGDNGAGTGDMLTTSNLSDLTNKPQALVNIGALPFAGGTMTGALRVPDGSAAVPGFGLAGANTSGLFRLGSNGLGFSVAGLRKLGLLDDGSLRGATDGTLLWTQLGAAADIVNFLLAANAAAALTVLGGVTSSAMTAAVAAAAPPVGSTVMWWAVTPPANYLECNGAALSRTTYAALFAAIGTAGGAGDGSTTFNVPDMRGVVPRGYDNGRGYDTGRVLGSYQADMVGPHNHSTTVGAAGLFTGGGGAFALQSGTLNTGTNSGTETRMKNVAPMFIIKYQ